MDIPDPKIKRLVQAIGRAETGDAPDAYTKKGASGEFGRYQFMPETYKLYAKKYIGDENAAPSVENQNKIAYSFVKEKKDAGYNPAQIASMWNAGEGKPNAYKENYKGTNSLGVSYDTPAYAQKVSKYYNEGTPTTITPQTAPAPERTGVEKVSNVLSKIFPGKEIGEAIAAHGVKEKVRTDNIGIQYPDYDKLSPEQIAKLKSQGVPTTRAEQIAENEKNVAAPTGAQVAGDVASIGLTFVPGLEGAKGLSTGAKIAGSAALGAGFGASSSIAGGATSAGDIGTSAAIGGVIGGALSSVAPLVKGAKGIISGLGGKTLDEVLKVPESEVGKLTATERKAWFQNQADQVSSKYKETESGIKTALTNKVEQVKTELPQLAADVNAAADKESVALKEKILPKLGEQSKVYGDMVKEALAPVEDNVVSHDDLINFIDSKYGEDKTTADIIKGKLGLTATQDGEEPATTTIGELYAQMKGLRSGISQASKTGGKVFTSSEYMTDKATADLVDFLSQNGVDLKEAQQFWAQWAPTRDRIVRETRLFDQSGVREMSMVNTLKKLGTGKASETTQRFAKAIEDLTGEPLGQETKDALAKLSDKQKEIVAAKIDAEVAKAEAKASKADSMKTLDALKFEAQRLADRRAIIRKVLVTAGIAIGAPTVIKHGIGLIP